VPAAGIRSKKQLFLKPGIKRQCGVRIIV